MPANPELVQQLLSVSDKDLIEVLRLRGHACVIAFAKKDEASPKDEYMLAFAQGGDLLHCLGLSAGLLKDTSLRCREVGVPEVQLHEVLAEGVRYARAEVKPDDT